ncbi:MAG: ParB/RepB/Spo0J family partition protein [Sphingomonadales bacterium]|nr:ParB/RepB/Spo0J family partition protein [Sphingomonadales bacterium]
MSSAEKGNRGFGAAMAENAAAAALVAHVSPATGVLGSRNGALSQLASGKLVTDRTEWIDPVRCRPWSLHNRAIELLDEVGCADLIESIKAEGRQRIPAIVRRLKNDPDHDYEIIAGVRRWWTINWLRAHNYPEFHYLITIQSVTDEEGFRLADVENRARRDISDIERARDYLRALDLFYGGSQTAMATRLNVSNSWMSRTLEVGRLPAEIVDAFSDSRAITARHAGQLAPSLRQPRIAAQLIEAALRIAAERVAGAAAMEPHQVVSALLAAAAKPARRARPRPVGDILAANGKPMLRVEGRGEVSDLTIHVLPRHDASAEELRAAVLVVLETYL